MLQRRHQTWKVFFLLLLCSSLMSSISGCNDPEERDFTKDRQQPTSTSASPTFQESPALSDLVQQDKLPPVAERMPVNPMVVKTVERIGRYGGTWHRGFLGNRDQAGFIRTLGYENLMRWNPEWTRPVPNVAQSVSVSKDASTYTFYLRKNMHWSDGAPFTADDIMFWYEDILQNPDFPDSTPRWLAEGRESLKVIRVDTFTVKFQLQHPDGLLLQKLAHPTSADPTAFPRHYVKQFLPQYNADLDSLIKEEGASDWRELFEKKVGKITRASIDHPSRWKNPDLPVLYAWQLKNGYGPDADVVIAERNPWYWKIDLDGNQLPYIDQIVFKRAMSANDLLDWAVLGQLDMQIRHVAVEKNRSVLALSAEKNGYHFFQTSDAGANVAAISLNLLDPDPVLRELFQNKKFRMALSHALDREKIIRDLYPGHIASQVAPQPESPLYNKELARQYLLFDRPLANTLLDETGIKRRDQDGIRLMKDGRRLSFTMETPRIYPDLPQLMKKYVAPAWKEIGVELKVVKEKRSLFYANKEANRHHAIVWRGEGGLDVILSPRYYFPSSEESNYAVPWGYWYAEPQSPLAQEPPPVVKKQMELYRKLTATADPDQQHLLMEKILEISQKQFYVIGICRSTGGYGISTNTFHNIPQSMPTSWTYPNPAPTNPAQYFITADK